MRSVAKDGVPPASEEGDASTESRIDYLRSHGVEVSLAGSRPGSGVAQAPSRAAGGMPFKYVYIPMDEAESVVELTEASDGARDVLEEVLAPRFAEESSMDESTVEREIASRLKNMAVGGAGQVAPKAPSAATLTKLSANGACEAYPLDRADAHNSYTDVKLYIDEVGALRGRGRNKRAEALAASAGLAGLSIHGDAYVGRSRPGRGNLDFTMAELSPSSNWCVAAHRAHASAAAAAGHSDSEVLVGGSGAGYAWSQTDQEVEVRVAGAPEGKAGPKRVRVGYGSGNALEVTVDGKTLVSLRPLFDRVDTDGCVWTLEGSDVVVSMEKADPRPWTSLLLSGNAK